MMVDDPSQNYLCMPTQGSGPGGARQKLQSAVHLSICMSRHEQKSFKILQHSANYETSLKRLRKTFTTP